MLKHNFLDPHTHYIWKNSRYFNPSLPDNSWQPDSDEKNKNCPVSVATKNKIQLRMFALDLAYVPEKGFSDRPPWELFFKATFK